MPVLVQKGGGLCPFYAQNVGDYARFMLRMWEIMPVLVQKEGECARFGAERGRMCLSGWVGERCTQGGIPSYTLPGIPWVYIRGVHRLPPTRVHAAWTLAGELLLGDNTSVREVEGCSVLQAVPGRSSPENKPLFLRETGPERPTIPPQKGVLHKEPRNIATPPKVTRDPP